MSNLDNYLSKHKLKLIEKIAKGWTSYIYLVKNSKGKKVILKVLREKSNRTNMVEKESENLKLANSVKVGPKLIRFDKANGVVQMEYVAGKSFKEYIFETNVSQKELFSFLKEILSQAKKLDKIGLDHGQLAGKGANILVKKNKPIIIDFEKASNKRRVGNYNQLKSFFFISPHSAIAKKVRKILKERVDDLI